MHWLVRGDVGRVLDGGWGVAMRRRDLITVLGGVAAWPLLAHAQQQENMRRIGFMRAAAPPEHELSAFLRGLSERGYVEGRNFVLVPKWGDGTVSRLSELAVALLNQRVEVVVTEGTLAVRAVVAVSTSVPVVTTSAADPFMNGLIKNLSRPGGNVTGFASMEKDISSKVFGILKEMVPGLRRIGVLSDRSIWPIFTPGQDEAAKALGIQYNFIDMPHAEAARDAMREAIASDAQGAVVRGSPYFSSTQRRFIIDSAAEHRLPVIYERRDDTERGGLVSYSPNVEEQYRATATYVVRILAGENPGDLPIQQPIKFDLIINLVTAKTLGLEIPPTVIARADEVIE